MKNVQESLAGRVAFLNLFPLAQSELLQKDNEIFPQESASLIKRFNEFEKYEIPDIRKTKRYIPLKLSEMRILRMPSET